MLRLPLVAVALVGCTNGMVDPSTVEQQNGACFELEGRTFTSASPLECGRTADGIERCHWTLTFATRDTHTSDFVWMANHAQSDGNEIGRAECRGQSVVGTTWGRTLTGAFNPDAQTLTWAGELYVSER